ncbi:putative ankyrin repeat protein RF_0381 [Artemia franciscana]
MVFQYSKSAVDLFYAVEKKDNQLVNSFLLSGRSARAKGEAGITPLHIAAAIGSIDICKLLLLHGARINALDRHLRTPLFMAVSGRQTDVVTFLLERNADPNSETNDGETLFTEAVRRDDVATAEILVEYGTTIPSQQKIFELLQNAVLKNSFDIVTFLVSFVDLKKTKEVTTEFTPFAYALNNFKLDIGRYLLQNGSSVQESHPQTNESVLHLTLRNMINWQYDVPSFPPISLFIDVLQLLYEYGFDFSVRCHSLHPGESLYSFYCRCRHEKPQTALELLHDKPGFDGFRRLLVAYGCPFDEKDDANALFRQANRSLKGMCRNVIRKKIGHFRVFDQVNKLDIPLTLKYYLVYEELVRHFAPDNWVPIILSTKA